jgi:hypothetical protein
VQGYSVMGLFEILGGKGSGNRGHSGGRGGPGNPGGSTPKHYHGTTSDVIQSIMKHGLSVDQDRRTFEEESFYKGPRKNAVFISGDEDMARYYALNALNSAPFKAKPVVLEIEIPSSIKLHKDSADGFIRDQAAQDPGMEKAKFGKSYFVKAGIKPGWIKKVMVLDEDGNVVKTIINRKYKGGFKKLSKSVVYYVGLAVRDYGKDKVSEDGRSV